MPVIPIRSTSRNSSPRWSIRAELVGLEDTAIIVLYDPDSETVGTTMPQHAVVNPSKLGVKGL